jgi:hypothetical protein
MSDEPKKAKGLNNWGTYTIIALAAAVGITLYFSLTSTSVQSAPSDQLNPKVAFLNMGSASKDVHLAVWTDQRGGNNDIVGAIVKPRDNKTALSNFPLTVGKTSQSCPAVAASTKNNEFLVVWEDKQNGAIPDIYGQLVKNDGDLDGANFKVTKGSGGGLKNIAVAYNSTTYQYLVIWEDYRWADIVPIYGQFVKYDGTLSGTYFDVSAKSSFWYQCSKPSVVYNSKSNEFLVVWHDYDMNYPKFLSIRGRRLDAAGKALGNEILVTTPSTVQKNPVVAYNASNDIYLVAWEDYRNKSTGSDIYGQFIQIIKNTGTLVGANFAISTASDYQGRPSIASGSQEFIVTFDDYRNSKTAGGDIYAQCVSCSSGSLQVTGSNFPVCNQSSEQAHNSLAYAVADDSYFVVCEDWRNLKTTGLDIYAQNFSANGIMALTSSSDNIKISVQKVTNPLPQTNP